VLVGTIIGGLFIAAILAVIIWRLASNGVFDGERWEVFTSPPLGQTTLDVWKFLLVDGLGATLRAAVTAAPIAIGLGILLAVLKMAPQRWIQTPTTLVIELFRGLPVVLMMFFGVVALGLTIFQGVVFGLVVYNMAVIAEILRAGIVSLPKGQSEAAYAIGLSRRQTLFTILLPQAVRRMLPSLVSQLVVLLKDTSLGFIVGYAELLRSIQNLRDFFGSPFLFPLFFVGAAIYIMINFTLSRLAVWLERRGSVKAAGAIPHAEDVEVQAAAPTETAGGP